MSKKLNATYITDDFDEIYVHDLAMEFLHAEESYYDHKFDMAYAAQEASELGKPAFDRFCKFIQFENNKKYIRQLVKSIEC